MKSLFLIQSLHHQITIHPLVMVVFRKFDIKLNLIHFLSVKLT